MLRVGESALRAGWPFGKRRPDGWVDAQPIRAELFGLERFREHAESLARAQPVGGHAAPAKTIVVHLEENARILGGCYEELCSALAAGQAITPAAEWLVDNYYLIEQQVRQAAADLPPSYYRQLPKLSEGPLSGHPRVFGAAWEFVAHTDSRFDGPAFTEFVNAYQTVQPFTIGELWAAAISLRLVLIENLARVSRRTVDSRHARLAADWLADNLLEGKSHFAAVSGALRGMDDHLKLAFVVQLIKRLRDHSAIAQDVIEAIRVQAQGLGFELDSAVTEGHNRQASANVTMRNIVTSLRQISDYDWGDWFESVSLVDRMLSSHGAYADMDFQTRNSYRSAVEDLSRHSSYDEIAVTRRVLSLCAAHRHEAAIMGEPGYHLVGQGRCAFEVNISYRPPRGQSVSRAIRKAGLAGFLGAVLFVTFLCLMLGLWPLLSGSAAWPWLFLLAAAASVPVSELAVSLVNFAVTHMLRPVAIPALALRAGIPKDLRTLVAIPALLTHIREIDELIERLEVHHLANPDGELYFALLTDWTDAATENAPGDDELLAAALGGIDRLNRTYSESRFLLLHRARKWNASEGKWMGWERKRGKLLELNRLLRGAADTSFAVMGGKLPGGIRFVLTLDADTRLPRNAARRLIGKLAHPLNRPVFDVSQRRIVEGYGILQPRVAPALPVGSRGSLYQVLYSTRRGTDPYAFAASDVYQDLFGEGSFAGKGIYDIDSFETALAQRVPENTMLSHDLFEGIFARAALVTDVEVVEDIPERYAVASARQHRWIRGDWQLMPWLMRGLKPGSLRALNYIPPLGLWKMVDNLRRSIIPVGAFASLTAGWLVLSPAPATAWSAYLVLVLFMPAFIPAYSGSRLRPAGESALSQLRILTRETGRAIAVSAVNLAFLAHQAYLATDAILRTLYRLYVSQKKLLEWTAAAQLQSAFKPGLRESYALMAPGVVATLLVSAAVIWRPGVILTALPFLALWISAPAIAWAISRTRLVADELAASPHDRQALRLVARRAWTYFEEFAGEEDNRLPPDNFQEDPVPTVAHRTSPTNIGLYLLATANARDFGWLGIEDALSRIEATLATVRKLERYRGHLYNWYDTRTLAPLEPRYVSTVDSGNLAGHIIALASICRSWSTTNMGPDNLEGIGDCAEILREEIASAAREGSRANRAAAAGLERQIERFLLALQRARQPDEAIPVRLIDLAVQAGGLRTTVDHWTEKLEEAEASHVRSWARALETCVEGQFKDASVDAQGRASRAARLEAIAGEARDLALAMEFAFLVDPQRQLLSVGFRVPDATLDGSCYDLLASEAALASFLAIAKGDLGVRHWFKLARPVTSLKGGAALLSWSGSMFEYLMPLLVLQLPHGSLLDQTARLIVRKQIAYGSDLGLPWGISESAFSARDRNFTYQYSNFGVPGLGLKHGLSDNLVVAPYAAGLAAMISPRAAAGNFEALRAARARGRYGFYEAVDYTALRLRKGEAYAVVKAYFAHHQGMTICAIYNAVSNGASQMHFHSDPLVKAAELLLQERPPHHVPLKLTSVTAAADAEPARIEPSRDSELADPRTAAPSTCLLSNGQFSTMLTASGSGYSTWRNVFINRWREDAVCDDHGVFFFFQDLDSGKRWTAGYMPSVALPDSYEARFSDEKVEVHRRDGPFATALECLVSTEDNAEARHLLLVNNATTPRSVEVTTYAELALATAAADQSHPAFSKLFVTTEFLPDQGVLLATRRKRAANDPDICVAQLMIADSAAPGAVLGFETSRASFLGRNRELHSADALVAAGPLAEIQGTVLDAVFALRHRLRIPPGRHAEITLWTLVAESRAAVLEMADRHRQASAFERAQVLAWSYSRIQLRHLSLEMGDASLFQRLASHLIYAGPTLRPGSTALRHGMQSQRHLWPAGISGDKPILLLRIDAVEDIDVLRQLLKAHEYWSSKHFAVDLVILNDRRASYIQDLQAAIDDLIRKSRLDPVRIPAGGAGVFALRSDLLPPDTLALLPAAARVVLYARSGPLRDQLIRLRAGPLPPHPPAMKRAGSAGKASRPGQEGLAFFNGFGGFDLAAREYVIHCRQDQPTPAPWINVIANANFGTQCAAEGPGATWVGNSRECQITQWTNDPVRNTPSEALYLRDVRSGSVTSPCFAPLPGRSGSHRARHGFGYSLYQAEEAGLAMEFLQFVPLHDTVKLGRLRVSGNGGGERKLLVTYFAELVLGAQRPASAPHIFTQIDPETGALFADNRWNDFFGGRVVFADLCGSQTSWSGDRQQFIGRYGTLRAPRVVLTGEELSNRTGAGLDPCAALQAELVVTSAAPCELCILLGCGANEAEARALVRKYRAADFDTELTGVKSYWNDTLGAVQVETPDPAFDIVMNGWLLYQTLACRMFGRAGFYQSSGAYGMRDQLQDSMALAAVRPEIARAHLLRAAGRQFPEGDLQHWWLPQSGVGVRTRISDDCVWLAHCVHHYVTVTGDTEILDEEVAFLQGPLLEEEEQEAYFEPAVSSEKASLYQHCVLALNRSLATGPHGLPLFGTGDWNDGMNRVGEGGRGESVWLGWFLYATLEAFSSLVSARGGKAQAEAWRQHMADLKLALDRDGWDGQWYRRGYFDDGTPLGSALSDECRIDSIAQSWAVISGAADPQRAAQALAQAHDQLVRHDDGIAMLFTPPFESSLPDPGYIKAYPPGIRENGGQYTHGAIWSVFAHAKLGEADKAGRLFALLNPINHARSREDALRYRVEPYVVAADVYSVGSNAGRGGWTWYTGAAGWLYRAGLEAILGVTRQGDMLSVKPCFPPEWRECSIRYRFGSTTYRIRIARTGAPVGPMHPDVQQLAPGQYRIRLRDTGGTADVLLTLGEARQE